MDVTPFQIRRFRLKSPAIVMVNDETATDQRHGIPGYFVLSTAPPNIEDAVALGRAAWDETESGIQAIATDLYRIYSDPQIKAAPELVIALHGYNMTEQSVEHWYSHLFRYINRTDRVIRRQPNLVFIGYRWSSECLSLHPRRLWQHLKALPPFTKGILGLGLLGMIGCLTWAWLAPQTWLDLLIGGLLTLSASGAALVATLMLLRVTGYFRDVYRAINFGVLDLVELLRRIDKALIDKTTVELNRRQPSDRQVFQQATHQWQTTDKKVRLNFIGHSMGALVVTNAVRILSDVFDTRSIARQPPADIGHTLRLERLVLVAPDIPVLSTISSRANVLASSLRRFNEAYLFTNEGDLALRLASTAANYISFPSATRTRGYRLGNVALRNDQSYGITNLTTLRGGSGAENILNSLYVTHSWGKGDGYLSLAELFSQQEQIAQGDLTLADLFTFFDCTDYCDYSVRPQDAGRRPRGLLTQAKRKRILQGVDYLALMLDIGLGRCNVHGGYFNGEFSQQLIYRLAFLGFEDMLKHGSIPHSPQTALEAFHQKCAQLGIQAYLSPLRYRVHVEGQPLRVAKGEMLRKIRF